MRFAGWVRVVAGLGLFAGAQMLTGCGAFFVCQGKASCPTTTGSGSTIVNTGDFAYVGNVAPASNTTGASTSLNGYAISAGALSPITGSPFSLNYVAGPMAVTPSNGFLFVASVSQATLGQIYSYTIGSSGALTINNGGSSVGGGAGVNILSPVSMDVSPDGQWLFVLDSAALTLTRYTITSAGLLSSDSQVTLQANATLATTPYQVKVAPSGKWVVCADGSAGDLVYGFTTSTGTLTVPEVITPASPATADFAIAMDGNDYLYVGRTNALAVYSLDSATPTTQVLSAPAGPAPRAITLDKTGAYVYSADANTSLIYEFGITAAGNQLTVAPLSQASTAAPTAVVALAFDNSGKYLVDLGYSATNGIQLLSVSSGLLTPTNSVAASGTTLTIPARIALTH